MSDFGIMIYGPTGRVQFAGNRKALRARYAARLYPPYQYTIPLPGISQDNSTVSVQFNWGEGGSGLYPSTPQARIGNGTLFISIIIVDVGYGVPITMPSSIDVTLVEMV